MVIREAGAELDVSGAPAELREVAHVLTQMEAGHGHEFAADTVADPAPYTRVLAAFRVATSGGPVRVSVVGNALLVTGAPEMLARLAGFFAFSDADQHGTHQHHEWWEGNESVAPGSRPLTITRS
ncbi:Uncharacterized protein OS=Chamaesiphon minutus PCC 6605 GN=Cha6605_0212 PE=4 SV=1 [Gemmata massiliana]|uniref:Uncharacterized protein n=1 Tax=Gemmata massiliana TaxID=1210884 RepID=A0A6P2CWD4_9BACT|nr:hypothetical protein [Gemmata massiliana]VTR93291.1 Uncharacterized protein OS=Chamaesiphon minutus PCC 6605 GN=Cha6605_0212 PE=4 SV=1 [Gemmata massiliana]